MTEDLQLPNELLNLSNVVEGCPEAFALGSKDIQTAALSATKFIFDLGASQYFLSSLYIQTTYVHDIAIQSEKGSLPHIMELISSLAPDAAPQTRSQSRAQNGKRKRSPSLPSRQPVLEETPLPLLFVDGMNDDQIWEQLDLRAKKLCETLEETLEGTNNELEDNEDRALDGNHLRKVLIDGDVGLELEGMDWNGEEGLEAEDSEGEEDGDDEGDGQGEDLGEDVTQELRDSSEENNEDEHMFLDLPVKRSKRKGGGHPELDDGFFELASFNAEADEGEAKSVSKGRLGDDEEGNSDSDVSVNLFAPIDNLDTFEEEDFENAGAGIVTGIYII